MLLGPTEDGNDLFSRLIHCDSEGKEDKTTVDIISNSIVVRILGIDHRDLLLELHEFLHLDTMLVKAAQNITRTSPRRTLFKGSHL